MLRTLLLAAAFVLSLTVSAQAQTLDDLRASGAIGERFDGLVVARDPAYGSYADGVNQQRLQIYREAAAQQGVTVRQVGEVYARQITGSAPRGTWFQDSAGNWRR